MLFKTQCVLQISTAQIFQKKSKPRNEIFVSLQFSKKWTSASKKPSLPSKYNGKHATNDKDLTLWKQTSYRRIFYQLQLAFGNHNGHLPSSSCLTYGSKKSSKGFLGNGWMLWIGKELNQYKTTQFGRSKVKKRTKDSNGSGS